MARTHERPPGPVVRSVHERAAAGYVRPRRRRPTTLSNRPMQLPVHVLHAGRGAEVAPEGRDPVVRGARTVAASVRPARRPIRQGDRRRADGSRGSSVARGDASRGCARRGHVDDDERSAPRPAGAPAGGLVPIKINCVVVGGTNEDEVVEFARWSREHGHAVRFIEYMPLDAEHAWERAKVVPSARILEAIDAVYPLVADGPDHEPATSYRFADGSAGGVGVIASVTEPFCDSCNRLRITAEGQLRACLFALDETDLRGPMRAGAADEDLEVLIRSNVWAKWSGHRINHPDFVQPERSMSAIGG